MGHNPGYVNIKREENSAFISSAFFNLADMKINNFHIKFFGLPGVHSLVNYKNVRYLHTKTKI